MGWLSDRFRDLEVAAQGLVRGVASGVGAIADIPSGIGNLGVMAANQFRDDGNQLEYFEGFNIADRAAEAVTWTQALNDRERMIMNGAQAVGEVGAFVAVTVGTAGLGGAAVGGAGVATRWAGATARVMNPVNVSGRLNQAVTAVEAGAVAYRTHELNEIDREAQRGVERTYENVGDALATEIETEQRMLQGKAEAMTEELGAMSERLADPSLSMADRQEILDRLDLIEEGLNIIGGMDDVTDMDERQELLDRLEVIQPSEPDADDLHSNLRSPLITSPSGEEVRTAFASGVENAAGGPEVPVQQVEQTFTREFA